MVPLDLTSDCSKFHCPVTNTTLPLLSLKFSKKMSNLLSIHNISIFLNEINLSNFFVFRLNKLHSHNYQHVSLLRMYFLRLESHFLGRLISFTGLLIYFTCWHREMTMNEKQCLIFYVNALGIWNLDFWHPRGAYIHINNNFKV